MAFRASDVPTPQPGRYGQNLSVAGRWGCEELFPLSRTLSDAGGISRSAPLVRHRPFMTCQSGPPSASPDGSA